MTSIIETQKLDEKQEKLAPLKKARGEC